MFLHCFEYIIFTSYRWYGETKVYIAFEKVTHSSSCIPLAGILEYIDSCLSQVSACCTLVLTNDRKLCGYLENITSIRGKKKGI